LAVNTPTNNGEDINMTPLTLIKNGEIPKLDSFRDMVGQEIKNKVRDASPRKVNLIRLGVIMITAGNPDTMNAAQRSGPKPSTMQTVTNKPLITPPMILPGVVGCDGAPINLERVCAAA
jgi:hypothetical protein